jgi:hypothetical protein
MLVVRIRVEVIRPKRGREKQMRNIERRMMRPSNMI